MTRSWSESTTSSAVTIAPALPTAVVSRPTADASAGTDRRTVIENPALGIRLATLHSSGCGCFILSGRGRAVATR